MEVPNTTKMKIVTYLSNTLESSSYIPQRVNPSSVKEFLKKFYDDSIPPRKIPINNSNYSHILRICGIVLRHNIEVRIDLADATIRSIESLSGNEFNYGNDFTDDFFFEIYSIAVEQHGTHSEEDKQ